MKRAVIFLIILLLVISPISAFSFKEFFGKIGNYITGRGVGDCEEGWIDNYRCYGKNLQREYVYEDCSREWFDWEYCPVGCSNNKCNDYHRECIEKMCTYVEGIGEDECSQTSDCYECNDADGGINYYEVGNCEDYANHSEFCLKDDLLKEFYCRDNYCYYVDYYCKDGCEKGACINLTANKCEEAGGICAYDCLYGYIENEELSPWCRVYIEPENGKEPVKPEITGEATYVPGKEIKCCIEAGDYCDYQEDCVAKYEYTLFPDKSVTINDVTLMMYGFDYEKFNFTLFEGDNFTIYGENLTLTNIDSFGGRVKLTFMTYEGPFPSMFYILWPPIYYMDNVWNSLVFNVLETDEESWVLLEITLLTSTEDYIWIHYSNEERINLYQIKKIWDWTTGQEITIQPISIQPENNLSVIRTATERGTIWPKTYNLELDESATYGDYVITFKDIRDNPLQNHGSRQYLIDVNGVSEWIELYESAIINGLRVEILYLGGNGEESIYIKVGENPGDYSLFCESNILYRKRIEYECSDNQCLQYLDKFIIKDCSENEYCVQDYDKCLPDDPPTIELRESDNQFIINGKPFFPIVAHGTEAFNKTEYEELVYEQEEPYFQEIVDIGFNMMVARPGQGGAGYNRACAEMIDYMNEKNMFILFFSIWPGEWTDTIEEINHLVDLWLNCSYKSPSVIMYYSIDEPAAHLSLDHSVMSPENHDLFYQRFKERDSYGHIYNINEAAGIYKRVNGDYIIDDNITRLIEFWRLYEADTKTLTSYFGDERPNTGWHDDPADFAMVGRNLDRLREAIGDDKPIGPILPSSAIWSFSKNRTIKELRFMSYQAIVYGANYLAYWPWVIQGKPLSGPMREGEGRWNAANRTAVKAVVGELSSIQDLLASENVERNVVSREGINPLLKNYNDEFYLITVNELNKSVIGVDFYNLDDYVLAEVLFENRNIQIRDGRFADNFEDYDVHVYYLREEENIINRILRTIGELFS